MAGKLVGLGRRGQNVNQTSEKALLGGRGENGLHLRRAPLCSGGHNSRVTALPTSFIYFPIPDLTDFHVFQAFGL